MPSFNLLSDAEIIPPNLFNLLSDAVIVPPNLFNLLSDSLILPPGAFALTSDALIVVGRMLSLTSDALIVDTPVSHQLALTSDADVALFAPEHKQRKPQVEEEQKGCAGCGAVIDCDETGPYDLYSLEGLPFQVILSCPPGFDCAHGSELHIICCKQELISIIPANAAIEERLKIIRGLLDECARREAFCKGGDCPPGQDCPECPEGVNCADPCALFIVPRPVNCGPLQLFFNKPQTCTIKCSDGLPFSYTLKAGVFIALSQVLSDRQAHDRACVLAKAGRICLSKASKTGCANEALEMRIYASGAIYNSGAPTLFWNTDSSMLPPGMTLSQPAFKPYAIISGTPTTPGTYSFLVSVTHAYTGASQSRTYTITVQSCPADLGNVTPDIMSSTRSYWNGSLLPGQYRINYVNGAWTGAGLGGQWMVGDGVLSAGKGRGYYIVYNNGGSEVAFPVSGLYPSQAAAEAGTLGKSIVITHTGGTLGIYLHDSPYADNFPGSPNPTFNLHRL